MRKTRAKAKRKAVRSENLRKEVKEGTVVIMEGPADKDDVAGGNLQRWRLRRKASLEAEHRIYDRSEELDSFSDMDLNQKGSERDEDDDEDDQDEAYDMRDERRIKERKWAMEAENENKDKSRKVEAQRDARMDDVSDL